MHQGLTDGARPIITMRMATSDEALALAAANGDGKAFGILLERHYNRLFGLCFRLTGRADRGRGPDAGYLRGASGETGALSGRGEGDDMALSGGGERGA